MTGLEESFREQLVVTGKGVSLNCHDMVLKRMQEAKIDKDRVLQVECDGVVWWSCVVCGGVVWCVVGLWGVWGGVVWRVVGLCGVWWGCVACGGVV